MGSGEAEEELGAAPARCRVPHKLGVARALVDA